MATELFTLGHSTHSFEAFAALLKRHDIALLADVRRFPGSRKYPHFNQARLAEALPSEGIEYRWFEPLGGRRKSKGPPSRNVGLRNESFRNYADYMGTTEFHAAVEELLATARRQHVAYMCSEGLFWRCHRRLISDFLTLHGHHVRHIMPNGTLHEHVLTEGAERAGENVAYPGASVDPPTPLFPASADDLRS